MPTATTPTEAQSVEDPNRALTETVESLVMWVGGGDTLPPEQGVHAGPVKIDPILRPEVVRTLLAKRAETTSLPAPPMEWLEAVRMSANDHYHPDEGALTLPVIEVTA